MNWLGSWFGERDPWNKKPEGSPPCRSKTREYKNEQQRKWRRANPDKVREQQRREYPPLSEMVPGYVPLNVAKPVPPPCGVDCENCPWDNGCHYPDWEDELERKRERNRRKAQAYRARKKDRRNQGLAFDAREKERLRQNRKKYFTKVRFVKKGGAPEDFERQLAAFVRQGGEILDFAALCTKFLHEGGKPQDFERFWTAKQKEDAT